MNEGREYINNEHLDDIKKEGKLIRDMLESGLKIFSVGWEHEPEKAKEEFKNYNIKFHIFVQNKLTSHVQD